MPRKRKPHVGDLCLMGRTPRDQKLWWQVLDVVDNKVLVTTVDALPIMQPYSSATPENSQNFIYKWSTCDINKWLNSEFISQYKLEEVPMLNIDHVTEGSTFVPEETTNEKVFLLSKTEVEKYFPYKPDRRTLKNSRSYCSWYLRSPGLAEACRTSYVDIKGAIYTPGCLVECNHNIRPAFWLDYS